MYPKVAYVNMPPTAGNTVLDEESVERGCTVPSVVITKNPLCSAGALEMYSSTFRTVSAYAGSLSNRVHLEGKAGKLK